MSVVLREKQGGIAVLTLNRPEKRNALNAEIVAELKAAFSEAGSDADVRAIVIRGAGKDFCSGADLASLQKIAESSYEENLEDARSLGDLFAMIRSVQVPVIAAVHGRALAGGCGLATACDIVLAADDARFGYPEVKIGFVPAMVTAILRRNLGEKKSFELLTRGFEMSAADAAEIGLVNAVFDAAVFEQETLDYARAYEKVSRSAVIMTKRLLYDIDGQDFAAALDSGARVNAEARMSDDCRNGIRKFLDKTGAS